MTALFAAAATAYSGAVVRRMAADYWNHETLTQNTVALMYGAYAANLGALALAVRRRSWPLPLPRRTARLAGATLATAGAAVAIGGASRFGSMAQLSGVEPGTFVTGGLYRHTRNPQYLGIVAAVAGVGLAARSGLATAFAGTTWFAFNRWIPSEERHLERIFGDQYRAYAAQTRRWLGPRTLRS